MNTVSCAVVVGALLAGMCGVTAGAQEVQVPRVGLVLSGGGVTIPDALGAQCGRNGGGNAAGLEVSGAVVVRPWRWVVLQADARAAAGLPLTGCNAVLFSFDTSYASIGQREPLATSTFRVGVETPRTLPLLRMTAGIGRVWGSPALPLTVFGLATGTRGRRMRVVLELEQMRARVDAEEVTNDFETVERRRPIVVRPVWYSVRFGVEIPLARQR